MSDGPNNKNFQTFSWPLGLLPCHKTDLVRASTKKRHPVEFEETTLIPNKVLVADRPVLNACPWPTLWLRYRPAPYRQGVDVGALRVPPLLLVLLVVAAAVVGPHNEETNVDIK